MQNLRPIHKRRERKVKAYPPITSRENEKDCKDISKISVNHEYHAWQHRDYSITDVSPFQNKTSSLATNLSKLQEAVLLELKFMLSIVINSRLVPYPLVESCLLKFMKYQNAVASSLCLLQNRLQRAIKLSKDTSLTSLVYASTQTLQQFSSETLVNCRNIKEEKEDKPSVRNIQSLSEVNFRASGVGRVLEKINFSLEKIKEKKFEEQEDIRQPNVQNHRERGFRQQKLAFFENLMNNNRRAVDCLKEVANVMTLETLSDSEITKLLHQVTKLLEGINPATLNESSSGKVYAKRSQQALEKLLSSQDKTRKANKITIKISKSTQTANIEKIIAANDSQLDTSYRKHSIKSKSSPLLKGRRTAVVIPLAKFMKPVPSKKKKKKEQHVKVRKLEIGTIKNTFIGEIYMKKAILDNENRINGRRKRKPSLAKLVTHYFTQKYGLKKLADEYVISLIHYIRENEHSNDTVSERISLFGKLLGVINPEEYSPNIGECMMQALSLCFRQELKQIAPKMSQGEFCTYILQKDALDCVRKMFLAFPTCEISDEELEDSYNSYQEPPSGLHTYTIPYSYRNDLIKWLEQNSQRLSDLKAANETKLGKKLNIKGGREIAINLDEFLEFLYELLLKKLRLDRIIFEELFLMYDFDGNGVLTFDEFTALIESFQASSFIVNHENNKIDLIAAGMIRECDAQEIKSKFPEEPLTEDDILEVWDEVNEIEQDDNDDAIEQGTFSQVCLKRSFQLPYWKLGFTMISNLNDLPLSVELEQISPTIRFSYQKESIQD